MLIPASDWVIEDTWHVSGIRGTGSKDILVEGAFVPADRALPMADSWGANPPGGLPDGRAIWRLPLAGYFGNCLLGPIVGMAEGGLKAQIHRLPYFGEAGEVPDTVLYAP